MQANGAARPLKGSTPTSPNSQPSSPGERTIRSGFLLLEARTSLPAQPPTQPVQSISKRAERTGHRSERRAAALAETERAGRRSSPAGRRGERARARPVQIPPAPSALRKPTARCYVRRRWLSHWYNQTHHAVSRGKALPLTPAQRKPVVPSHMPRRCVSRGTEQAPRCVAEPPPRIRTCRGQRWRSTNPPRRFIQGAASPDAGAARAPLRRLT